MVQVEKNSAFSGLITTSHNPSHFLRKLSKLLTFCLPDSVRINRGSLNKNQLLNYCWNNKILRLIIVQGFEKKDSAIVEFYNLEKSQRPVKSVIQVTDVIFPRKGIKETRIDTSHIHLSYSTEIIPKLKESIDLHLKPFLISDTINSSGSKIEIRFTTYDSHQLLGKISHFRKKENLEILTFRIMLLE
ncbi:MAG: hypothetical protein ACXAC6_06815 [Candidatus Hodarchaeales archaeon]